LRLSGLIYGNFRLSQLDGGGRSRLHLFQICNLRQRMTFAIHSLSARADAGIENYHVFLNIKCQSHSEPNRIEPNRFRSTGENIIPCTNRAQASWPEKTSSLFNPSAAP
jgi:hypothetical protein